MRWLGWTCAGLVSLSAAAWCQAPANPTPPAVPTASPETQRLDQLLAAWEQRMKSIESLVVECSRAEFDKTYNSTELFVGTARYLKPNLARLDLQKKSDPNYFEKYVCNGQHLYEYRLKQKMVRVHELPKNSNGISDDTFLSFLFGMKAEDAKRRYELRLVKEDQWWIYVEILPRYTADKQEFSKAQMVLYAAPQQLAMLPRRLWFQHPNGSEITWEFPKVEPNARLNRQEFVPPQPPKDWVVERASAPQTPAKANPPAPKK